MIGTIDLPAHNAYVEPVEDRVSVVGGAGLETLATPDTSSYIRFDKDPSTTGGNGWAFRVGRGGSMLGFGLVNPNPTGPLGGAQAQFAFAGTVTDVRFVMVARLPFGGGGTIPGPNGSGAYGDGSYPVGWTNLPVYRWPMIDIQYQSAPYGMGGYNFSNIQPDGAWAEYLCDVQLAHVLPSMTSTTADYVIAGIGTPDTGLFGLCPRVLIDTDYPWPNPFGSNQVAVDIAYLAIRVTYEAPDPVASIDGEPDLNRAVFW